MAGDGATKEKVKKRKRSLSSGATDASPVAGKRQKVASSGTPVKKAKKVKQGSETPGTPKTPKTPKSKKKKASSSTPLSAAAAEKGRTSSSKTSKKKRTSVQVTSVSAGDSGSMSCLSEKKVTLRLHLLPHTLQAPKQGILHVLMDFLMKYNTAVGGVVLSFSDVVIPKKDAAILSDFAHMHFSLRCKMTVFTPTLGTYLHGVVSQVGFDHVGLLVFGHFNASIAADSMPTTYERDAEEDQWVCTEDPSVRLVRGSVVRFRVTGVFLASSGSFSIAGDLKAPGTRPLGIIEDVPEVFHMEAMQGEDGDQDVEEAADMEVDSGDVEMGEAAPPPVTEDPPKEEKSEKKLKKKKAKTKSKDAASDSTPAKKVKKKKKKRTSDAAE